MYTVADVVAALPDRAAEFPELPAPQYLADPSRFGPGADVGFCVPSMRLHTTDEGWQLFLALEAGGYVLCGSGLAGGTDVGRVAEHYMPRSVVVQDKREWEGRTAGRGFDARERLEHVGKLRDRDDVFKLTVLKDAQNDPGYHRDSAAEIGCHTWVTYYHLAVVKRLAPYVRQRHLVRTYHTVDRDVVPRYSPAGRRGCLLSGAVSSAYPLRQRLVREVGRLPDTVVMRHPGYGRAKCHTPDYLRTLSRYKVAICTASRFGYALRKIVEATAAGCVVVTDLPADDVLPGIDGNLVRVHPSTPTAVIADLVRDLTARYEPSLQEHYAAEAVRLYDYRAEGVRLAAAIEAARKEYRC